MESFEMQDYMRDSEKMFKVYKRIGGRSTNDEYKKNLRLFYYHTLNSHVHGMGPEYYEGAATDENGFALYDSDFDAEQALMDEAKVDHAEFSRIFRSVDRVHSYS